MTGRYPGRRIYGIETEFGVTCSFESQRRLSPDEAARYLFRQVVEWGRSSNVFLVNGARLYLDVGSHPEYATGECDSLIDLIAQDKAGERILLQLSEQAEENLRKDGMEGDIYLFKNNVDSAGNSYGCHENYLVRRKLDFGRTTETLIPFLITRQLIAGAGYLSQGSHGARYCFSQRADHMWEDISSATTRSRPIINSRDEPHADANEYRRLHIIVGDSSMSETTTLLKVGSTELLLRYIEAGGSTSELSLLNPIRDIRTVSQDLTAKTPLELQRGGTITPLALQEVYFTRVRDFAEKEGIAQEPVYARVLSLWERTLRAIEQQRFQDIDREIDWAIKGTVLERYRKTRELSWRDARLAQLDLAYHDIHPSRGLYQRLAAQGLVERVVSDEQITQAMTTPPQSTRSRVRGAFIEWAQREKREYTVDWVHLKLTDFPEQTIVCKDPFLATDERVERLMAQTPLPRTPQSLGKKPEGER